MCIYMLYIWFILLLNIFRKLPRSAKLVVRLFPHDKIIAIGSVAKEKKNTPWIKNRPVANIDFFFIIGTTIKNICIKYFV